MPAPPPRSSSTAVLFLVLTGCTAPPPARPEPPAAPVRVATAAKKTVPVQVRAIGTVKVVATVSVRPRVGGELTEVHFKEGDQVKKGQRLFTIDPRPYQTAVAQAEATLTKDQATLSGAELDLRRMERIGGGAAAAVELDAARTAVAISKATVTADEAAVRSATLQLGYTSIDSPIDGRTGALLLTAGNLVNANDVNPLVVINQVNPIYVMFALTEQELPAVAAARRQRPLKAEAYLRAGEPPIPGVLAFIDNAVDPGTGTVQLKAEYPNTDRKLWPGQFVDVVLTVGERSDSVTVPAAAVQVGQQGTYVFVVRLDGTAEQRPVTVAFEADGEAVVAAGLTGGETVVTEGQLRLVPGAKVDVKKPEVAK